VILAASTVSAVPGQTMVLPPKAPVLPPKAPPTNGQITRMFPRGNAELLGEMPADHGDVCVASWTVRVSLSYAAVVACGSIALWWYGGVL
jgi:hypothetical protein